MAKGLRITRHGIHKGLGLSFSVAICSPLFAPVSAQGLDYEVRPFVPQESSLIVVPTIEFAKAISEAIEAGSIPIEEATRELPPGILFENFATVEEMSSAIKNIDEPIYTDAARAELASDDLVGTTGENAAAGSPSGYVEVRDITQADAAWLQLEFSDASLGGATVSVSSPETGRRQTLNETALQEAGGTTVIFAGTTVRVEVQAPAGSNPPKLDELIKSVIVGSSLVPVQPPEDKFSDPTGTPEHSSTPDEEASCGEDARVLATHKSLARMTPKTCTAFLIEGGLGVSAGHCFRDTKRELLKLEFNVPPSDIDGEQSQSAVDDTYGILIDSIRCSDCESNQSLPHGQDWAVFRLVNNTETGKSALETQGAAFSLADLPETESFDVDVLGYGKDDDPPNANFSLQSAIGEYRGIDRQAANLVAIKHLADTEKGSSGAPIVLVDAAGNATDQVVGIHTGGWCSSDASKPNMGTSFLNEELSEAIRLLSSP